MLFAYDLVLLASKKDDLQCSVYNFQIVASKYSTEIFAEKIKVMFFRGKKLVPNKILDNKTRKSK
jgi:hypothetical protein